MLVYAKTKKTFSEDVQSNQIEHCILDAFQRKLGHKVAAQEVASWKNSLMYMHNALLDPEIPDDTGVAIEYRIPQTSKRIDFILTGLDEQQRDTAVIVELKQWQDVELTNRDAIVQTFLGGTIRDVPHPSYQAWTYAALLEDYNEAIYRSEVSLYPCAYLHNCEAGAGVLDHRYKVYLAKAPVFLRHESKKLTAFIKKYVRFGDQRNLLYRIEEGKIKPSKNLADSLATLLKGQPEFLMIDDQKVVYEQALDLAKQTDGAKQVLIVEGGPGTGKSVVAINLLVEMTKRGLVTQYVSRNAAPREVYESKLTGTLTKTRFNNLFRGSGAFIDTDRDTFDALIVDEAHRLNEKSGLYRNLGENQIKEIINAAKLSVFFLDENQKVTLVDIGDKDEIRFWAKQAGAAIVELELASQFRCNGSDGYLAWLDNTLQIRETANETLEGVHYDFRVCDGPTQLREMILEANARNNRSRLVAGYCWDWASKKNRDAMDIEFPEYRFAMQWNLTDDGSVWILKPHSVEQIGCIHTCQGLELEYVGVIIGPDLVVRDGEVIVRPEARSRHDKTIHGYKKQLADDPQTTMERLTQIVKNTYRTLMTRGQKGCYIWSTDPETNLWFKAAIGNR